MGSIFKILSLFGNNYVKWKVIWTVRAPSSKYLIPNFQYRSLTGTIKHHSKKDKPLSSTSIIVQDGLSVLEMPRIVQIINGDFEVTSNGKTDNGDSFVGLGLECHRVPKALFKKIDFQEESEMALGFMKCNSLKEVVNLLNTCPEEEITPCVALAVIRRIFDLENNFKFMNEGYNQYLKKSNNTFTRSALIKRLIETICASIEPQVIVDTLRSMGRDTNKQDQWKYLEQVCAESIILATDGKLNVSQVCEVIKAFHNLGNVGKDFVDKVWVGINDKKEISEDDLCEIMSILPLVKNSRTYLYNIVERKIPLVWHKLKPEHIIRIVYILVHLKTSSNRLLSLISRWTNLSIHRLTEGNLRWIVYAFLSLEYTDENIQKALSRYMKAKKTSIKDYSLVSVILDYCKKLRIRHPTILNFGAKYYIEHGQNMPASQTSVMANCFGYLKHTPEEPQAFFQVLESQIGEKFSQFTPKELLDIFHSCIYLERYPLNFVKKVFNPQFFNRLYSSDGKDTVSNREKLLILDTVLTIETSNYNGPILPRNYSTKAIRRDARTLRCINRIIPSLVEIVGSEDQIYDSVIIPALPPVSLFVVDCVVDATGKASFSNFKLERKKFALFILLPEYYDITEKILLGPQSMKKRIIEYFGFKVVGLNYRILNRLLMYPDKLKEYLQEEMEKAPEL